MTPTTLCENPSDQTFLDQEARLELRTKIALRERLLALLEDPATPIESILKLKWALDKMEERPLKQQKAELAAIRQQLRARQLAIDEARIEMRCRALELREAEHQRKSNAAEARETARQEKAARKATRQNGKKMVDVINVSFQTRTTPMHVPSEPIKLASPAQSHGNESIPLAQKAA